MHFISNEHLKIPQLEMYIKKKKKALISLALKYTDGISLLSLV